MGTEGRLGDPAREIPASKEVYEYIVFKGSDLQDLKVMEAPSNTFSDPAILSMPSKPRGSITTTSVPKEAPRTATNRNNDAPDADLISKVKSLTFEDSMADSKSNKTYFNTDGTVQSASKHRPARDFQPKQQKFSYYPDEKTQGHRTPHRENNYGNKQEDRSSNGPRSRHRDFYQGQDIQVPEEDFDIQSSNMRFHKDKLAEVLIPEAEFKPDVHVVTQIAYNKEVSFFDDLSCKTKDQEQGIQRDFRTQRRVDADTNVETFGRPFLPNSYERRGRGRGRGGNRGDSRGGYRGGHSNYQSSRHGNNSTAEA